MTLKYARRNVSVRGIACVLVCRYGWAGCVVLYLPCTFPPLPTSLDSGFDRPAGPSVCDIASNLPQCTASARVPWQHLEDAGSKVPAGGPLEKSTLSRGSGLLSRHGEWISANEGFRASTPAAAGIKNLLVQIFSKCEKCLTRLDPPTCFLQF